MGTFEFLRNVDHTNALAIAASQGAIPFLSRMAAIGQIGYVFELLLTTATVVMGAIGLVRCLGWNTRDLGAARIDEHRNLERNEHSSDCQTEVTIRLDSGFRRVLNRRRCIVTIHRQLGGVQDRGREVWYARDEN